LVSLININLSAILPQSSEEAKSNILETKSLAKQLLGELKALSASLNTDHILHIGLENALHNELKRIGTAKKYQITFTKTGEDFRLTAEKEIILFRLCQEILNNILKYAKASSIITVINYTNNMMILEISDDGIGFDLNIVSALSAERESTGLLNIQKRAKMINAVVEIKSEPEKGTTVIITIPKN
jgi:signal transduction histidine kinase